MDETAHNKEYSVPHELRAFFEGMARYELKGTLGQGGMGTVFQAYDKQLQRNVAIKVQQNNRGNDSDSVLNDRFIRETRALAALDHPNIVKILNSGISPNGIPFYVMELLSGQTLSAWIQKTPSVLSGEFFKIVTEISSALEHIHAHGLVHRDLKTSNIMICDDETKSQSKIIDFGIVRQTSGTADNASLTVTNSTLGSPSYMSPEQCRGAKADHLSDIYSLACIMYEFISGNPPLQGATAAETMYKHLNEPAPKVQFDHRSKPTDELARLIASGLERDPKLRPQSAAELTERLKAVHSRMGDNIHLRAGASRKAEKPGRPLVVMLAFAVPFSLITLFLLANVITNNAKKPDTTRDGTNQTQSLDAEAIKARPAHVGIGAQEAVHTQLLSLERTIRRMSLAGQIHELAQYSDLLGNHFTAANDPRRLAALAVGQEVVADCRAKHKRDELFAALFLLNELQLNVHAKLETRIATIKEALSLVHDHTVEANFCHASLADLYLQSKDLDAAEASARSINTHAKPQTISNELWSPSGNSFEQRQNCLLGKLACLRNDFAGSLPYFAKAEKHERDDQEYPALALIIHDKSILYSNIGKATEARKALAAFEQEVSQLAPQRYDALHLDIVFGIIKQTAKALEDKALLVKASKDGDSMAEKANRPKTDQQIFQKALKGWR